MVLQKENPKLEASSKVAIEGIEPISIRNMNETIQERIFQFIGDQKLSPGTKLPSEGSLSEALSVSRVSLREAMKSMEALGILEARAGSGWYIKDFSFESIAKAFAYSLDISENTFTDLQEVRVCLEIYFLPQAMHNLLPNDFGALESLVIGMETQGNKGEPFYEEDRLFHKTLFSKVPNQILSKVLDLFWSLFRYLPDSVLTPEEYAQEARRHRLLLDALYSQDVSLANQRLVEHFEHTGNHAPQR